MDARLKKVFGLLHEINEGSPIRLDLVAFVSVSAGMLDKLASELTYSSYDNGHLVVSSDEINEWMACEDDEDEALYKLLKAVDSKVPLGFDVTFSLK